MTTIQDEYQDTLNAWNGSSPKQQQRRLAVKEAGFWSDCAAQPYVPDGAGLISKKAAQQATAVRFPEYDPRSDPHLSSFFDRQEERAIQVRELREHRVMSRRSERGGTTNGSRSPSARANSARFRRGGKTQASLAKVAKQKPVRMPKPPPGTIQAPAPSQKQAQQSDRQFALLQQQQQQQQASRPQSARSMNPRASATAKTSNNITRENSGLANSSSSSTTLFPGFHLDFTSHLCPELQALDQFRRHQQLRDEQRERESHRRAVHESSISRYSSSLNNNHSPYAVGTSSNNNNHHVVVNSPSSSSQALHSQTTSINTRTICMPVDSNHVLAVKRLFVRSAVERNGNPCRTEVCAIKNACENYFVILTREVDLPAILYMGIAQSNRFRQVAGLAHMTVVPSPEVIFNWLVVLGCTETVDWPSFLILCTADLATDYDKVADIKTAYQQFTDKTPLDSGLAYQKVLLYLKSVASAGNGGSSGRNNGGNRNQGGANFSANAFHDEVPQKGVSGGGFDSEKGGGAGVHNTNRRNNQNYSTFFQPGDFYGPRHTCSFAEALFSLMPYRIQFHLIKANARGFSVSKNFRGRVPHSSQIEGEHDHGDEHDTQNRTDSSHDKRKKKRSSSSPSNDSSRSASSGHIEDDDEETASNNSSTPRNLKATLVSNKPGEIQRKSLPRSPSTSSSRHRKQKNHDNDEVNSENGGAPKSKAIRFHTFKNAKSRFLEEQAAESRYERKVWL